MQKGWSYIKDSGDFLKKIPNLGSIPENAILVMADVVGLYPSIPHEAGLKALREVILKNNYFEFNRHIKQQISGPAIGTTFAPPYACLFMDKIETAFLETQELQPLVWSRYIDDIFLSGHMVSKNFKLFCVVLMSSILTSNLLMSQAKKALHFLTLKLDYYSKIIRNLYVKSTDRHQYLYYLSA